MGTGHSLTSHGNISRLEPRGSVGSRMTRLLALMGTVGEAEAKKRAFDAAMEIAQTAGGITAPKLTAIYHSELIKVAVDLNLDLADLDKAEAAR